MGKTALALNLAQHACITQAKHQHLPEDERPPRYLIVVDYLQLMRGSPQAAKASREQEISEISRGLKSWPRSSSAR
jgi:replicative DNA helicase